MCKLIRYFIVTIMSIVSIAFLAGCSSDSKIVGTYVNYEKAPRLGAGYADDLNVIKIEKNGDGYILKKMTYMFDNNRKYLKKEDVVLTFIKNTSSSHPATIKDNSISSNGVDYAYVEKDDSLVSGKNKYIRVKDIKELEKYKTEMMTHYKDEFAKDQRVSSLSFKDRDSLEEAFK